MKYVRFDFFSQHGTWASNISVGCGSRGKQSKVRSYHLITWCEIFVTFAKSFSLPFPYNSCEIGFVTKSQLMGDNVAVHMVPMAATQLDSDWKSLWPRCSQLISLLPSPLLLPAAAGVNTNTGQAQISPRYCWVNMKMWWHGDGCSPSRIDCWWLVAAVAAALL